METWTVTEYEVPDSTAYRIRTVKDGVTPEASPTRSMTMTLTASRGYNLAIVEVVLTLTTGAVAESDLKPETTISPDATTQTEYYTPKIYIPPATCSPQFTGTYPVEVHVPTYITQLLTPTATSTVTSPVPPARGELSSRMKTYTCLHLSESALPANETTLSSVHNSDPCQRPTSYYGSPPTNASFLPEFPERTSGAGDGSDGDGDVDIASVQRRARLIRIVPAATIVPSLFLFGFLESFCWFRRVMQGRSGLRGGAICWILISGLVLLWTRIAHSRPPEQQTELRERWQKLSSGERWNLWWTWAFRHDHPADTLLGNASQNVMSTEQPVSQNPLPG